VRSSAQVENLVVKNMKTDVFPRTLTNRPDRRIESGFNCHISKVVRHASHDMLHDQLLERTESDDS